MGGGGVGYGVGGCVDRCGGVGSWGGWGVGGGVGHGVGG